jgi:hypothetical protein
MDGMADHALDAEPDQSSAGARDTFVIRVWTGDDVEAVRGHIMHVRSRRRAYFATRQRLQTFIEEHLKDAGSQ